jgi:hypothetical protein
MAWEWDSGGPGSLSHVKAALNEPHTQPGSIRKTCRAIEEYLAEHS